MKRKIVEINEDLCNGCGLCVSACHEGAIQMVAGKARLVSDAYCDGLGDCLPACPTGAIQITEREAAPFDAAAVAARQAVGQPAAKPADSALPPLPCGCPGQMAKTIERKPTPPATAPAADAPTASELTNWPVQIKLVNVRAPYLQNAALLVAADCTAFAYPDIHRRFMRNKVTLIGCPKLDEGDYAEKLTAILQANDIKSVTVLRMEVPCCGGITQAVTRALQASGKMIPWQVVTVATDGTLLDE
ncbi:MAG TPA: 4Fe-4S binding protein [Kiritimatiellia bacterium]|nr:4Fe-4S binding protein [Kiritimatiellia bacterium]MBP9572210.1 4Fe-4S binding protein [Kiritimatiellia bacterium]HPV47107.1 4Fe-4S binding protein [Kiritimatiellia bacterium]HQF21292.1 4Fe-4S binding protein [Kiritimatiellia bacterium]HQG74305.1 4Fe-4S binding protein [Kiritimatiellia bacterium]